MIQISNYAISYSYTCLYPCGEDNVRFVVNNDLRSQDAQIGLSITQNALTFIKDDATEVRTLIDSGYDYKLNLNNLAVFQLDLANYEDDGIIVKVPLISSSAKDFLQNTTLETLGLTKVFDAHFVKKPKFQITTFAQNATNFINGEAFWDLFAEIAQPSVISGVLLPGMSMGGETPSPSPRPIFFKKIIPIGQTTTFTTETIDIYGYFEANTSQSVNNYCQIVLSTELIGVRADGTQRRIATDNQQINSYYLQSNTLTNVSFSFNSKVWTTCQETYGVDTFTSAFVAFVFQIESIDVGKIWTINHSLTAVYTFEENIDYHLPSISLKSIYDACAIKGITLPNELNTTSLFVTSPNIAKLNNTKVVDIVTFLARMRGKIINFGYDSCSLQPFSFIFGIIANIGNNYCKYSKKGFAHTYSYKIGKNPSKMRLANIPEGMWANTYSTKQNSNLLKQDRIDTEIIYDGAEILNILISNDQSVFIIDNTNNNIASGDDTPFNYNFAACMVTKNNLCRMVSNSQDGATTYAPDDTAGTPYTIPNSGGLATDQSQTYSGYRLAPYTEEMDVPFTASIISYILSLGLLCGLNVNGIDYIVESCEFGIIPSQVHFVGRRVISA